jgi:hypothetical protein
MILFSLGGGLGNQLIQLAYLHWIDSCQPCNVYAYWPHRLMAPSETARALQASVFSAKPILHGAPAKAINFALGCVLEPLSFPGFPFVKSIKDPGFIDSTYLALSPELLIEQLDVRALFTFITFSTPWPSILALAKVILSIRELWHECLINYASSTLGFHYSNLLAQMRNAVVLHVRRGDYLSYGYHLLDGPYYKDALQAICELRKSSSTLSVFYVSDDLDEAGRVLASSGIVARPLPYSDPLIALFCLVHARYRIGANSTFSIMAALISSNPHDTWFPLFGNESSDWNVSLKKSFKFNLVALNR